MKYKGYTIKIEIDNDPMNPRDDCNLGEILYTSSRYTLGDSRVEADTIQEITERNDVIYLPVYAYIHGSVMLSTSGFSDVWDSGQCGIIYCEMDAAKAEFPSLDGTELIEVVKRCLEAEVEMYSKYLSGDMYGYIVESSFDEDSCWGFYSREDALNEAKAFVDDTPIPKRCEQAMEMCV